MSTRDDQVSIKDMLSYAVEATEMLGGESREELKRNRKMQLALTRLVEVVGEAANRISPEARCQYSKIPWLKIVGMRNRLVHGYDVIDLDLLWDTVTGDFPSLIAALKEIVEAP